MPELVIVGEDGAGVPVVLADWVMGERWVPADAVVYTRRGRGSQKVGPPCHTCGGRGLWFDVDDKETERRPRICRDCPAFYAKGQRA
jgi:hypothetical protein